MSKTRRSRLAKKRGAEVVSLMDHVKSRLAQDPEAVRVLADVGGLRRSPELGQRTPPADLKYWDRKTFSELTLERVISILRKAENGDVEELADLWLRMLKTDAHLASVWESRTAPVYSAPWAVVPSKSGDQNLAVTAAKGCEDALRQVPELEKALSSLLNARGVGFEVAEIVWGRGTILGRPAWVPSRIEPIHSRRFRFSDHFEIGLYDDGRAVGALRASGWIVTEIGARGAKIARLPAGKYVVHQPIGIHDYPSATGLVHSIARWWWVKQVVTKYWLSGAELGANPRIIGKILQNAAGRTMDEFTSQLESLAADGVMVLREGAEVEIHEGVAGTTGEVWGELFRRMDLVMTKAVLGSTLNVEIDSTGGNRAAAESQDAVTIRPRQRQDAAQLWATLSRDVFHWVIAFNPHIFLAGTPCPTGRSDIVEATVPIDQLAIDSGAVRVDEMRARCGLPLIGGDAGQRFITPITRTPGEATTPSPAAPGQAPVPVEPPPPG